MGKTIELVGALALSEKMFKALSNGSEVEVNICGITSQENMEKGLFGHITMQFCLELQAASMVEPELLRIEFPVAANPVKTIFPRGVKVTFTPVA